MKQFSNFNWQFLKEELLPYRESDTGYFYPPKMLLWLYVAVLMAVFAPVEQMRLMGFVKVLLIFAASWMTGVVLVVLSHYTALEIVIAAHRFANHQNHDASNQRSIIRLPRFRKNQ